MPRRGIWCAQQELHTRARFHPTTVENSASENRLSAVSRLKFYVYSSTVVVGEKNTKKLLRGTIVNRTYGTHKNLPGTYFPVLANNILSYLLPGMVPRNRVR